MSDLSEMLQDGPPEKGSYLSRIFGIFNEEIVRIWARDPRSPYEILEKRPTLYEMGKYYTLDFLLLQDGKAFVSEMKCEIQYQNYRYWRLAEPSQLKHHKNKKAFELFLQLSKDPGSVSVKANGDVEVRGTILVWGAATEEGIEAVKAEYGISDVITVENCINDLVSWENESYLELLDQRDEWSSSLFSKLRGKT
jgi:hypothetical protein